MSSEPFHAGEIAIQERTGERDSARRHGVGISSRIMPGAVSFLERQRLLAVSAVADDGQSWTSAWCGEPGFVRSTDGQHVCVRPSLIDRSPHDPVLAAVASGRDVGMLAIEFSSRRRLRINGSVAAIAADEISVIVRESVGNCPKYIQRRRPELAASPTPRRRVSHGHVVDEEARMLIARADTAFVGSVHPTRGTDASHRRSSTRRPCVFRTIRGIACS
jgi:uncharacterized protein